MQEWMTQAESAKTLLTVMENGENQSNLSEYKGNKRKFRNFVLLKFLNKNEVL